jgi:hypothetical protein
MNVTLPRSHSWGAPIKTAVSVRSSDEYNNFITAERISVKFSTGEFHEKLSNHIGFGKHFIKIARTLHG